MEERINVCPERAIKRGIGQGVEIVTPKKAKGSTT
jgi:hypothetical protein